MKFFKYVVLLFIIGTLPSTSSLAQRLDLTPGTKRSYFRCTSPWPCPATVYLLTTNEVVLETTMLDGRDYAKVSITKFYRGEGRNFTDSLFSSETVYYRMYNDTLWQRNEQGEEFARHSYHISQNGEIGINLQEIANSGFFPADTTTSVLADTTILFPNDKEYRVYWGISDSTKISDTISFNRFLVDSILYDVNQGWLTPNRPLFDEAMSWHDNSKNNLLDGFYYIEGVGAVMYPYNHVRNSYLIGFVSSDGDTMGTYYEPKFYVSTEPTPAPHTFSLHQNYPNPFNPTTIISYDLHEAGFVELTISDVSGRLLKTLISNNQSAGHHHQTVDLSGFASGVYFYTLQTTNGSLQKQMTLVK